MSNTYSNTPLSLNYCYGSFSNGEEIYTEGVGTYDNLDSVFEAIKKDLREDMDFGGASQLGKIEIWIEGQDMKIIDWVSRNAKVIDFSAEAVAKSNEPDTEPESDTEEEEQEYEYHNYATQKTPAFGEISYQVAGGGLQNGNAYATIELKNKMYYYCEYGKNSSRSFVGDKIVWSDEIYDKQNPYECRNFNIID